jgi:hypothetical protein
MEMAACQTSCVKQIKTSKLRFEVFSLCKGDEWLYICREPGSLLPVIETGLGAGRGAEALKVW